MQNLNSHSTYIGKFVDDHFQIQSFLGKGTTGRVYYAEDPSTLDQAIAVKFLDHQTINYTHFAHQAEIATQLAQQSPHLCKINTYGLYEDQVPFYMMEYLRGESLAKLLQEQSLSLDEFLNISHQICFALQNAHQGIEIKGQKYVVAHEDLKPSNIFIMEEDQSVKILDFALAGLIGNNLRHTKNQGSINTLGYRSPEQMRGETVDPRSDIYSLGIIMYEMLMEQYPWQVHSSHHSVWYKIHNFQTPRTFQQIDPYHKIPEKLEKIVMQCLEKKPEHRPQSIQEVLDVLDEIKKIKIVRAETKVISINQYLQKHPHHSYHSAPATTPEHSESPTAKIASLKIAWPTNKPIKNIVFSKIIKTHDQIFATLWTMLPQTEIEQITSDIVTLNNYAFLPNFEHHPLVLWSTILYGQNHETHWLNCFLDLKSDIGIKMLKILAKTGIYRVLFFAQESPQTCTFIMTFAISHAEQKVLQQWLEHSQNSLNSGQIEATKQTLKWNLEQIKPTLIRKLMAELGKIKNHQVRNHQEIANDDDLTLSQSQDDEENYHFGHKLFCYLNQPINFSFNH
jgi:eukaryotic-like serine/threonine-protein kinase